jgi:cyanate lyase
MGGANAPPIQSTQASQRKSIMHSREELTLKIQNAKHSRGLSWKEIGKAIGPGSPILYTAALLG